MGGDGTGGAGTGGAGTPGGFGKAAAGGLGISGSLGISGGFGGSGIGGGLGGSGGVNVYFRPSTSWPSMNALPNSSTLTSPPGGTPMVTGIGAGAPGTGGGAGGSGITRASFFTWSSRIDCFLAGSVIIEVSP